MHLRVCVKSQLFNSCVLLPMGCVFNTVDVDIRLKKSVFSSGCTFVCT